jgi:hypothetical protein
MKLRTVVLLLASLAPATRLTAQIQINLDGVAAKAKETAEITLDASMLQMAGNFFSSGKGDDAQKVKSLISGLKAITVRNFKFEREGQYRPEDLQPIREQLRSPGWSKVVGNENKATGEVSEIYTKTDQGKIAGFMILSAEPKELSVVYIEGTIDLAGLASLGGNFGIPSLPIPDQKKTTKGKE